MCCSRTSADGRHSAATPSQFLFALEGFQKLQKDPHPCQTACFVRGAEKKKLVCVFRASGGESASAPGAHPPRSGVPVLQSAAAAHVTPAPHLTVAHHDH